MELSNKKDERKFTRASKSLAVEYHEDKKHGELIRTFMMDISVGGGCLITYCGYKPGQVLVVRISIPVNPEEWVDVRGRVVESLRKSNYKYSTRMEFVDLNHNQKNLIQEFVKRVHFVKELKK
ncbi:MAG: PilZ domain-containing protein [Candidatus Omnitrophota bacterium]|nr:PilZ domain-containing protein [Candidatus Omnitrophota bacterium]MBU1928978.1 PilZ domain-containing protein [Candidatus Omnitrophota bacterium]MBU2035735.1 PilZ domain-containing protein [Candidatus Omnitrophota bacterium]MBU2258071.1 PilZ domain-containing protein [Candidatus Omnitrophota bacterium]